jgi:hypothetical protein
VRKIRRRRPGGRPPEHGGAAPSSTSHGLDHRLGRSRPSWSGTSSQWDGDRKAQKTALVVNDAGYVLRRWIPDIPTYWCLIAAPSARTYCQRPRWTGWLTRPGYTPSATPAGPAAESPTSRRPRAHRRQRRHQLLATANASAHSAADVLRAAGKSRRQHVHQPLQRLRHGDRNSRLGGGRGVVPAPCRRWCRWPRRPGRRPRAAGLTCRLPVPQRPNARLSTEPGVRRSGAAVGPRSRAGRRPDPLLGVGAAEVLPKSVVVIDLGKICQS